MTVPLSENERRQLQQIERDLAAQDPRLASSLRHRRWRRPATTLVAVTGVICGLVLMFVGLEVAGPFGILIADAGYLVLLFGTASVGSRLQLRRPQVRRRPRPGPDSGDQPN
jgi:hypothetical protein